MFEALNHSVVGQQGGGSMWLSLWSPLALALTNQTNVQSSSSTVV